MTDALTYRNRRAVQIENDTIRVTVLAEGGHIAEILHKPTGVNPLWTPPWPSIEPSTYRVPQHPEYGDDAESKLLAGIMGHNVCIDVFGGVSAEEAAAGMTVHGDASVAPYSIAVLEDRIVASAALRNSRLHFERRIRLGEDGRSVLISETLENLSNWDRPIAWTQHVTLGPPFLERGQTRFEVTATRSKVLEGDSGKDGYLPSGAEFDWPHAPLVAGGTEDLRVFTSRPASAGFTTHLMDPGKDTASFTAWSPSSKLLFGYEWDRADFPWLGIWEENHSRTNPPWNGVSLTRGMEFGVSPFPETRRQMIMRGSLFGVPGYRWLPARSIARVEYRAFIGTSSDGAAQL